MSIQLDQTVFKRRERHAGPPCGTGSKVVQRNRVFAMPCRSASRRRKKTYSASNSGRNRRNQDRRRVCTHPHPRGFLIGSVADLLQLTLRSLIRSFALRGSSRACSSSGPATRRFSVGQVLLRPSILSIAASSLQSVSGPRRFRLDFLDEVFLLLERFVADSCVASSIFGQCPMFAGLFANVDESLVARQIVDDIQDERHVLCGLQESRHRRAGGGRRSWESSSRCRSHRADVDSLVGRVDVVVAGGSLDGVVAGSAGDVAQSRHSSTTSVVSEHV